MDRQASAPHPDPDQLVAFGQGRLADPARLALERHLEACPDCARAALAAPADGLGRLLREAADPATVEWPPAPAATLPPTPAGPPADLQAIGRYRLLKRLGRGGMGTVYLAEHAVMGRRVALKVLDGHLAGRPDLVERFQREVRAAALLDHPNIVRAHDAEQVGGTLFLVMEYVPGIDLAAYLARKGPVPVHHACAFARQAALGLQHAHEQGMVHRDVKPHNLMLTPKGQVKILDFGLAKLLPVNAAPPAAGGLTASGVIMGTPDYMAPEQANDCARADVRSDLYSLGCTLYHLLTGRVPFPDGGILDKLLAHATERPTPLADLRPEIPPELAQVVARLMHKDPARRYPTPAAAAQALAPFTAPTRAAAPTVPLPPPPRRRQVRRRPWLLPAGVAALLALAALAVLALQRPGHRPDPGSAAPAPLAEDPPLDVTPGQYLHSVAVAPDGRGLVCGGYGCPVRWIGLTDPRRQRTMEGSQRLIHVVRFSADGQRVCAVEGTLGTTMAFQEWDLATGQLIRRLPKIYLAVPLPDGRRLLGVPTTARTRLAEFDLDTQQMVGGRAMEHPALLTTLETDRAGRWALTGCADGPDHRIRLWDVAAGRLVRTWDGPLGYYGAVALAADGSRAAWGEPDRIVVWDLAGDRAWHALPRPDGTRFDIRGLAFTADGRLVTSTGPREGLSGGAVSVWDLATGRLLATTATTSVRCLAVTPDGRRAVTGHYDGTLHFWRLPQAPGK